MAQLDEKQRFCKEVVRWKQLSCPYIAKFNGAFYHNGVPAIVAPWMLHRTITKYLEDRPDANRLRLVSLNVPPCDKSELTSHLVAT